jgi:hypothetical protein
VIFAAVNVHAVFQLLRRIALRHLLDLRTEKDHSMASHTREALRDRPFGDSGSEPKSLTVIPAVVKSYASEETAIG